MKDKRGAMEMSVGTIVTIVLLMSVLVLGIFLVQKIFTSSSGAIDQVDTQLQNQINQLFAEEGKKLVVMPTSRDISIKKGKDPSGFAFSVVNKGAEQAEYNFEVKSSDVSNCGSTMTNERADSYVLGGTGSFTLAAGGSLDPARLIRFVVSEEAPICTIIYELGVYRDGLADSNANLFLNIK